MSSVGMCGISGVTRARKGLRISREDIYYYMGGLLHSNTLIQIVAVLWTAGVWELGCCRSARGGGVITGEQPHY